MLCSFPQIYGIQNPMTKDFDTWNNLKQTLDAKDRQEAPLYRRREIWWCSVGVNVGFEIFGKNENFVRPVIILRKYSPLTFFGLPMTSNRKNIPSHFHFDFRGTAGSILLDQGKTFDARRLVKRMGRVNKNDVQIIKQAFIDYL